MIPMQFVQRTMDRAGNGGGMLAQLSQPRTAKVAGEPLFAQILTTWRRRRWVIMGCVAGAMLVGLILTLLVTPKYTASTTIEIQREGSNAISVGNNDTKTNFVDQEFYETQYGLLRSDALAKRVVVNLRLQDNVRFLEMYGVPSEWIADGAIAPGASTRDARINKASAILLDNFSINAERLSRLVDLRFTSPDPAMSKQIVDAWAQAFIRTTLDRRFDATSYARQYLEQRLQQLRGKIDESERQLVGYARREGIVNVPAAAPATGSTGDSAGERSLVAENLSTLNAELASATADRVRAESRVNTASGQSTEALQNTAISTLRQQRSQLTADYARLMVQFQPEYPPAQAIQRQIAQMDRAIAAEEQRVSGTLRQNYQSSLAREQDLERRVDALKSGVLDFRQRSIQYNIIQRDADTNRQLYDALLQRYKEIGVAGGVGVNNIAVVDPAELPTRPSSPRLFLNLALALLGGLALGAMAALVLEQMDQGISDPKLVETMLGVPLLGTIPRAEVENVVAELQNPKSVLYESYLSLQTTLSFATDHGVPRTLSVTSTQPGEGKSTTSYALARLLARMGRSVVLIDGDMRSPSVHHELGIRNEAGLSTYLSSNATLADVLHATGVDRLSVITAGQQPPSAPELLASERFTQMLSELRETFDHVVIDAPPVMGLADAPIVGGQVEGMIFVIQSHATHQNMVRVALERLAVANVNVLGAVMTKYNPGNGHYGYGYGYGYEYGKTAA
jgi:succinoglycan biosynthesis transport protein ExoP